jgi:hypothetical protein
MSAGKSAEMGASVDNLVAQIRRSQRSAGGIAIQAASLIFAGGITALRTCTGGKSRMEW